MKNNFKKGNLNLLARLILYSLCFVLYVITISIFIIYVIPYLIDYYKWIDYHDEAFSITSMIFKILLICIVLFGYFIMAGQIITMFIYYTNKWLNLGIKIKSPIMPLFKDLFVINKEKEKINQIVETDNSGNRFIKVDNIRVSYIKSENRNPEKDWPGEDVLRIQAYIDPEHTNSLHKGAELPISSTDNWDKLINALIKLKENR